MGGADMGAGDTMLAPGVPVPGTKGAGAVACGPTRLRVCAKPCAGANIWLAAATSAAAAQRRNMLKSHPDITIFLGPNHGNFMPGRVRQGVWYSGRKTRFG
jgi:hypothetical protein